MTQVVTSLETWCRYGKIPFYLQRERRDMCSKEWLNHLITDCPNEGMGDWNDARMECCTQAARNVRLADLRYAVMTVGLNGIKTVLRHISGHSLLTERQDSMDV